MTQRKSRISSLLLLSFILLAILPKYLPVADATETYSFLTKWGSFGTTNSQFDTPVGIAVDPSGNVYVVDTNNNRIQKFTSDGQFLTSWGSYGKDAGQFDTPVGIEVDSSSNVYVADEGNNRIQKFTSDGQFLTMWGSYGTTGGKFNLPSDIAIDSSGHVYVIDRSINPYIQKFISENSTGSNSNENKTAPEFGNLAGMIAIAGIIGVIIINKRFL